MIGLSARSALGVLMPQLCVACDGVIASSGQWLCTSCAIEIARAAGPSTRVVGLADGYRLRVRYALDYTAKVSKVIAGMKYGDKPGLASLLAPFLRAAASVWLSEDPVLVPVPMHAAKKRQRGYNQSEVLSLLVSKSCGVASLTRFLVKTRDTAAQAALEKEARTENVAGSFALRHCPVEPGRRVILVDDVVTTGSTLRACAEAVRTAYEGEVSACVVASSL
jgi:ComF family protein